MTDAAALAPALPLVESDEHRSLREAVYGIASDFGHDYFARTAKAGRSPRELWHALADHGYLGVNIPAEYDGGGHGLYELTLVEEEISAAGCPLLPLLVSPGVAGAILSRHATPEQKDRWLRGLGTGQDHYALALTEPDAGSNSHNISTRARKENGRWLLRGTKTFISGVEDCQAMLVLARTGEPDERGRGRLSMFICEPDVAGLDRQVIETVNEAPEQQWTLFFDDVELDEDRLIGAEGDGLKVAFEGLNPERILAAAICNGVARYALRKAAAYASERTVWNDKPIGTHQGVSHPLAESMAEVEAARLMTSKAALLHDAGAPAGEASNMAKLLAADAAGRALDRAIQAHGGNGLAIEYGLADLWFIVRLQKIAPVSREMILNYVAHHSLGLPKSY